MGDLQRSRQADAEAASLELQIRIKQIRILVYEGDYSNAVEALLSTWRWPTLVMFDMQTIGHLATTSALLLSTANVQIQHDFDKS